MKFFSATILCLISISLIGQTLNENDLIQGFKLNGPITAFQTNNYGLFKIGDSLQLIKNTDLNHSFCGVKDGSALQAMDLRNEYPTLKIIRLNIRGSKSEGFSVVAIAKNDKITCSSIIPLALEAKEIVAYGNAPRIEATQDKNENNPNDLPTINELEKKYNSLLLAQSKQAKDFSLLKKDLYLSAKASRKSINTAIFGAVLTGIGTTLMARNSLNTVQPSSPFAIVLTGAGLITSIYSVSLRYKSISHLEKASF